MSYHSEGELGDCENYVTAHKKCQRKPAIFHNDSGSFQCEYHRTNQHYTSTARQTQTPLENVEAARMIVLEVWKKMLAKWREERPYAAPWFMPIKWGYKFDRRFYRAIEAVTMAEKDKSMEPYWEIHLAGAPSHICQREGVKLHNASGNRPKLWVYIELVGKDMTFYTPPA